jgi:hypothetical protein
MRLMEQKAAAARHEKSRSSLHGQIMTFEPLVSKHHNQPTEVVPLKRPGFVGLRKPE